MQGCRNRGWDLIFPGGVGFLYRVWRCRPGGSPFSSPVCLSCRCMAGFLILPGCRWLHKPSQSAISRWGWDFHTAPGGIDPGDRRFRPWFIGVVDLWKDLRSGDGILSSLGGAGSISPSQSAIGQWGRDFHSVQGGIAPGEPPYSSRVVGITDMYGNIYDPGMGPYPPRVRRSPTNLCACIYMEFLPPNISTEDIIFDTCHGAERGQKKYFFVTSHSNAESV